MARSYIKKAALFCAAFSIAASGGIGILDTTARAEGEPCVVSEKLVNSCRPWLGAAVDNYPDVTGEHQNEILAHEQRIGRQLDAVHLYHAAGTRPLSDEDRYFANRANTILSVTWQPASIWRNADGRDTAVNAQIDAAADDFKALGSTKVMLTLHHEPEDQVSGGAASCTSSLYIGSAGTPADFRAMWRNVHNRFEAKGVNNVVWVLNYMGAQKWDCLVDDMYPGDDLVDWIMWDPYTERESNFHVFVSRFYNVLSGKSSQTPDTNGITHNYASKPWGLAEWGSWHNATQENAYEVYRTAQQAVETNVFPRLKYYSIFDVSGTCRIAYDRNGVYDAAEIESYRSFANSPVFRDPIQPVPQPEPTPTPLPDTIAPSIPASFAAFAGQRQVTLSWTAATDNVGVTGYYVVRDGVRIATLSANTTSFTDTGLASGKRYWYQLRAFDSGGNRSEAAKANAVAR